MAARHSETQAKQKESQFPVPPGQGGSVGWCRCRLVFVLWFKDGKSLKRTLISGLGSWLEDEVFAEVQSAERFTGKTGKARGATICLSLHSSGRGCSTPLPEHPPPG